MKLTVFGERDYGETFAASVTLRRCSLPQTSCRFGTGRAGRVLPWQVARAWQPRHDDPLFIMASG